MTGSGSLDSVVSMATGSVSLDRVVSMVTGSGSLDSVVSMMTGSGRLDSVVSVVTGSGSSLYGDQTSGGTTQKSCFYFRHGEGIFVSALFKGTDLLLATRILLFDGHQRHSSLPGLPTWCFP